MERTAAVVLLGRSMLDYLPVARQSSSLLATTAGLAPGRTVPCTSCAGKGRVLRGVPCASCMSLTGAKAPQDNFGAKHGCSPCLVCAGLGWRKRRKGEEAWDDMARVELTSGNVGEGTEGDDLERRLAHTTRLLAEWEKPESVAYVWEARKEAMWRAGDYEHLYRALEQLSAMMPGRYRLWRDVYVIKDGKQIGLALHHALAETTVMLAGMMPKREIRVPRWLLPEAQNSVRKTSLWRGQTRGHELQRGARDQEIVAQREAGWKVRKIATHHSLTERRVKQIIRDNMQPAVASAPA